MQKSLFNKEIAPFILMFGALIVFTIITDAFLHLVDMVWVGRWLGIPGTLLIVLSFTYSLRKRKLIHFSTSRKLLDLHEKLTLAGSFMILVHGGVHIYAVLPRLALFAMLVNVASGITGKYLLERSRKFIAEKESHLKQNLTSEEIDKKLFWDAVAFGLMKKWREVHVPITLAFFTLATMHIFSILIFWQWK